MNKKYKHIFFDLDDTVLSFKRSESYAIKKVFRTLGVEDSDTNVKIFKEINLKYWKRYEKGEVELDSVLVERFCDTFDVISYNDKRSIEVSKDINDLYFKYLAEKVFVIDGAIEVLLSLKGKYNLYLITNGVSYLQRERLDKHPIIRDSFLKIYISQDIGIRKPKIGFMNYILDDLKVDKKDCLIIGDSMSSDMTLAHNANIDKVWFNDHFEKSEDDLPFEIEYICHDIREVLDILT